MSSEVPTASDRTAQSAKPIELLPPAEKFWQRHSPHQELPLSGVGSFTLHLMVLGLLVLMAIGFIKFGGRTTLPVETVELGGSRTGDGNGDRTGGGVKEPEEAVAPNENKPRGNVPERLNLKIDAPATETKVDFDNSNFRFRKASEDAQKTLSQLQNEVRNRPREASTGSKGPNRPMTPREKRWARWVLRFSPGQNGEALLREFADLRAVLGIPTARGEPPAPGYYFVRNFSKRPAEMAEENLSQFRANRYYVFNDPKDVAMVLRALGRQMEVDHIVVFLPEDIEGKLLALERAYRGLPEDEIEETIFEIQQQGGRYEPRVSSQTPRR